MTFASDGESTDCEELELMEDFRIWLFFCFCFFWGEEGVDCFRLDGCGKGWVVYIERMD